MSAKPPDEQLEEIEALAAIYGEEFTDISRKEPCFMIRLSGLEVDLPGVVSMKILLLPDYPDAKPSIELPLRSASLSQSQHHSLVDHLYQVAEENLGMPMVFTLVEAAKEWINQNVTIDSKCEDKDDNETETPVPASSMVELKEPKIAGGRWDFTIGLVGKPSAGKSTFFNAATSQDIAKVGAHPFTTIEPNIGKGWYSIPCPCAELQTRCNAAYGHNVYGERLVPVLLKDVAGLVPGACDGKGRGNRFLNDLLGADVLIHIIDVSGCTDEKGEVTSGYDPGQDIIWLHREIKQWILDNILDKWEAIKKRPGKLVDMFTGYHANLSTIHKALHAAGIDQKELTNLPNWDPCVLDRLVEQFLQIRFPIFLVLNKCDLPDSLANIDKISTQHLDASSLQVCAKFECELQQLSRSGKINYENGDTKIEITCSKSDVIQKVEHIRDYLTRVGSTNVQQALSLAVKLRQPTYAYPVQCLDTYTAIDKFKGEPPGKLRDCISLRPHTTVEELYTVLLHYPISLAAGDFIRAEFKGLGMGSKKRILRKDEEINDTNYIIKVMTNRKITQVKPR